MARENRIFSDITIVIIVVLCTIGVLLWFFLGYPATTGKCVSSPRIIAIPLRIAGLILGILIWIGQGYIVYLITTRADRIKERVSFLLRILKFGLKNGLDDKKIVEALCEERRPHKTVSSKVKEKLAEGTSMIDALCINKNIFPESISSLLKAGEKMGNLDSMVSYAEESVDLDRMIQTRMSIQFVYPLLVLIMLLPIMPSLHVFVYPTFTEMIHDLTSATGNPVRLSFPFLKSYAVIVGVIVFWLISYIYFLRSLSRKRNHLSFVRVLSSALSLDIEEKVALELAIQSGANSRRMRNHTKKAENLLQEGFSIDDAIAQSFPQGEEVSWFFKQARKSDAAETFKAWAGILKDKLNRKADLYAQLLSTLLIFCVGVCVWLITSSVFNVLTSITNMLMW